MLYYLSLVQLINVLQFVVQYQQLIILPQMFVNVNQDLIA